MLTNSYAMSHKEIAAELQISELAVLEAEQQALRKLRANPEFRRLLALCRFDPRD